MAPTKKFDEEAIARVAETDEFRTDFRRLDQDEKEIVAPIRLDVSVSKDGQSVVIDYASENTGDAVELTLNEAGKVSVKKLPPTSRFGENGWDSSQFAAMSAYFEDPANKLVVPMTGGRRKGKGKSKTKKRTGKSRRITRRR